MKTNTFTPFGKAYRGPFFALEAYGADYHHLEEGDVAIPDGLVNVQSATLNGDKETEVYGLDGNGEKNALLLGNEKLTGEVQGYASAFSLPAITGALVVGGATLARKGWQMVASVGAFTMTTINGVGARNIAVE